MIFVTHKTKKNKKQKTKKNPKRPKTYLNENIAEKQERQKCMC